MLKKLLLTLKNKGNYRESNMKLIPSRQVIDNLKNENMALRETIVNFQQKQINLKELLSQAKINDQQTQLTQNLAAKNASFDTMRAEYEMSIENEQGKIVTNLNTGNFAKENFRENMTEISKLFVIESRVKRRLWVV